MITAEEARKISAEKPIQEALEYIHLEIKSAAQKGEYEISLYDKMFTSEFTDLFIQIRQALGKAGYAFRILWDDKKNPETKHLHISWGEVCHVSQAAGSADRFVDFETELLEEAQRQHKERKA